MRIAGIEVPHRLWTARELAGFFSPEFVLADWRGQGILRPVDDRGEFAGRDRWERLLAALPIFRGCGTFYSLELLRRG